MSKAKKNRAWIVDLDANLRPVHHTFEVEAKSEKSALKKAHALAISIALGVVYDPEDVVIFNVTIKEEKDLT